MGVVVGVATTTAPSRRPRVTRDASPRAVTGSSRWFRENAATTMSKTPSANGKCKRVADHGGRPPIAVDDQHPGRHVDGSDGSGTGARRGPARRARAGAEIEHGGAGERDLGGRQLLAAPDCRRSASARRATPRRPPSRHRQHRRGEIRRVSRRHRRSAPARARSHHQPSSASSPSAFSQPNWTSAPSRQSSSCRSNHPAVVMPWRSRADRKSSIVDSLVCPTREPGPVQGEVPRQLVAGVPLTGLRPVEQHRAPVGRVAEVAELPVAVDERAGRRCQRRRRAGSDRCAAHRRR